MRAPDEPRRPPGPRDQRRFIDGVLAAGAGGACFRPNVVALRALPEARIDGEAAH